MRIDEYPEGATPLEPEEMDGLKIDSITTREELNEQEASNILEALAWLDNKRKEDILTSAFIIKVHEKMFGNVWRWAGEFRKSDKNIGVRHYLVSSNLEQLLGDVKAMIVNKVDKDEILARFHHRLVAIHPFPNGNGRHSRMMCDILAVELGVERFTWGKNNLTSVGETRTAYIKALKTADEGDYSCLLAFVRT
jgi:Fic-DOC domain mobile mystery protein B